MEIIVHLSLSIADALRLTSNSMARVMTNAEQCGAACENFGPQWLREDGSTLWQDCVELRPLVDRIWCAAAEAVRNEGANKG